MTEKEAENWGTFENDKPKEIINHYVKRPYFDWKKT